MKFFQIQKKKSEYDKLVLGLFDNQSFSNQDAYDFYKTHLKSPNINNNHKRNNYKNNNNKSKEDNNKNLQSVNSNYLHEKEYII